MFVLAEDKGEGIQHLVGSQPDIPGLSVVDGWFEIFGEGPACYAVKSVSRDQQIVAIQLLHIVDFFAKAQGDAHLTTAPLQNFEQGHTRDTGDDMSAAPYRLSAIAHVDGIPLHKLAGDLLV